MSFPFNITFFCLTRIVNNTYVLLIDYCSGYLIPKGWKVMPLFRNIHHNPELFAAPHSFDPSRFEVGYIYLERENKKSMKFF